jgi:hypothetical protein
MHCGAPAQCPLQQTAVIVADMADMADMAVRLGSGLFYRQSLPEGHAGGQSTVDGR